MVVLKTQRFIRIADCQNIIGSKSNTSAILVVVSLNSTILTTLRLVHFLVFALIWVLFQFHRILSAALSTRVALTPTQRGNSTPTPSTSNQGSHQVLCFPCKMLTQVFWTMLFALFMQVKKRRSPARRQHRLCLPSLIKIADAKIDSARYATSRL